MNKTRRAVGVVAGVLVASTAWAFEPPARFPLPICESKPPCLAASALPIVVSAPGSYRLCGNLVVQSGNAIEVTASDVTIDMGGFSIIGPSECSRSAGGCTIREGGLGISAGGARNVTVFNGTVRGMGGGGVVLGPDSRVEKVKAISNGMNGIRVGWGSIVASCIADSNEHAGITASEYSTLRDNVAHANLGDGINGGCVSTVLGNSATSNGGAGITTGGTSGCSNNLACENQGDAQIAGCTQMGPNTCCYGLCP